MSAPSADLVTLLEPPGLSSGIHAQALHRASATPDYFGWLEHVKSAAGCTHPIRLKGVVTVVEADTGRVLRRRHTDELPDGMVYKACGNRRAAQCPDCACIYQGDAFQLIRAGIIGGKTVSASVTQHPVVFATFTAPSFGLVHSRTVTRHTCLDRRRCDCRPQPCHARRDARSCEHGQAQTCFARHEVDDPRLGGPLCLDCYDHDHHVVWNYFSGELWRRTKQAIERHLATRCRQRGIPFARLISETGSVRLVPPVRVAHGKVAEMQRRGAVHFHTVLRLDGIDPDNPHTLVPPPAGLTVDDLDHAIRTAARQITFTSPPHPDKPDGWPIGWGEQVDVRPINHAGGTSDEKVAGYLAKYATKSTEITGHCSTRLTPDTIDTYADPDGDHTARLIAACWRLGRPTGTRTSTAPATPAGRQASLDAVASRATQPNPYAGLRRWAHMLGFGGHFLTKARRYSTTFGYLRAARATYRRSEDDQPETTLLVGSLAYAGAGWLTDGDALLANTAAATAREQRRIARQELAGHHDWPTEVAA